MRFCGMEFFKYNKREERKEKKEREEWREKNAKKIPKAIISKKLFHYLLLFNQIVLTPHRGYPILIITNILM